MKVVFLDIDGVLAPHSNKPFKEDDYPYAIEFSKTAVKNLKKLLEESGAKIVLSTRWVQRIGLGTTMNTLASHGIYGPYFIPKDGGEKKELYVSDWTSGSGKFYGCTVTPKKFSSDKCHEIAMWLRDYKDKISGYVVLDDDFIHWQEKHQVQTDGEKGFTNKDLKKALKILASGISEDLKK